MVQQQGITPTLKARVAAINCREQYPDMSISAIGKHIGKSHSFVSRWIAHHEQFQDFCDRPRSGRPTVTDPAAVQNILEAAKLAECKGAAAIAARTQQVSGKLFSPSTVKRVLKANGLKHMRPRLIPLMTAKHKADRVAFAKKCMRRELVSYRQVLITDSKYFLVHPKGSPAASWCTTETRGTVSKVKHSSGVHVYMGISYYGVTKLMYVTSTHQKSKYINPKTKRLYDGVPGPEYGDVIVQCWKPEGDRLFQKSSKWSGKWKLQQDGARPHTTVQNMALIASVIPRGHFHPGGLSWPANSPDLSPIENLWSWMDAELHKQGKISGLPELKERLEAIRERITADHLHALFDSMQGRMKRVIELNGEHTGY